MRHRASAFKQPRSIGGAWGEGRVYHWRVLRKRRDHQRPPPQRGMETEMAAHEIRIDHARKLADEPETGHNRWHPDIPPILTIDPGDEVLMATRDGGDALISRESTLDHLLSLDLNLVHPLTGPVYIEDAEPGDLLAVEILDVIPGRLRLHPGVAGLRLPARRLRRALLRQVGAARRRRRLRRDTGRAHPRRAVHGGDGRGTPRTTCSRPSRRGRTTSSPPAGWRCRRRPRAPSRAIPRSTARRSGRCRRGSTAATSTPSR